MSWVGADMMCIKSGECPCRKPTRLLDISARLFMSLTLNFSVVTYQKASCISTTLPLYWYQTSVHLKSLDTIQSSLSLSNKEPAGHGILVAISPLHV